MEASILKCMLVTAAKSQQYNKVDEFFRLYGDELLGGPDAVHWRPWCALAFVQQPSKDPLFQAHFSAEWQQLLEISFRNFISEVLIQIPLPSILRFSSDRQQRIQLTQQVDAQKKEITELKHALDALARDSDQTGASQSSASSTAPSTKAGIIGKEATGRSQESMFSTTRGKDSPGRMQDSASGAPRGRDSPGKMQDSSYNATRGKDSPGRMQDSSSNATRDTDLPGRMQDSRGKGSPGRAMQENTSSTAPSSAAASSSAATSPVGRGPFSHTSAISKPGVTSPVGNTTTSPKHPPAGPPAAATARSPGSPRSLPPGHRQVTEVPSAATSNSRGSAYATTNQNGIHTSSGSPTVDILDTGGTRTLPLVPVKGIPTASGGTPQHSAPSMTPSQERSNGDSMALGQQSAPSMAPGHESSKGDSIAPDQQSEASASDKALPDLQPYQSRQSPWPMPKPQSPKDPQGAVSEPLGGIRSWTRPPSIDVPSSGLPPLQPTPPQNLASAVPGINLQQPVGSEGREVDNSPSSGDGDGDGENGVGSAGGRGFGGDSSPSRDGGDNGGGGSGGGVNPPSRGGKGGSSSVGAAARAGPKGLTSHSSGGEDSTLSSEVSGMLDSLTSAVSLEGWQGEPQRGLQVVQLMKGLEQPTQPSTAQHQHQHSTSAAQHQHSASTAQHLHSTAQHQHSPAPDQAAVDGTERRPVAKSHVGGPGGGARGGGGGAHGDGGGADGDGGAAYGGGRGAAGDTAGSRLVQVHTEPSGSRHSARVTVCQFSPSGQNLATGSADGAVAIWSVPGMEPSNSSRDATLQGITAWHADTRRITAEVPCDQLYPHVLSLACSPLEPLFLCSTTRELSSGPSIRSPRLQVGSGGLPSPAPATERDNGNMKLSRPRLVAGSSSRGGSAVRGSGKGKGDGLSRPVLGRLSLWNLRSFKKVQAYAVPDDAAVTSIINNSQDNHYKTTLPSASNNTAIVPCPQQVQAYAVPDDAAVTSISFNRGGTLFAAGASSGHVHLYEMNPSRGTSPVHSLTISHTSTSSPSLRVTSPHLSTAAAAAHVRVELLDDGNSEPLLAVLQSYPDQGAGATSGMPTTVQLWSLRNMAQPLSVANFQLDSAPVLSPPTEETGWGNDSWILPGAHMAFGPSLYPTQSHSGGVPMLYPLLALYPGSSTTQPCVDVCEVLPHELFGSDSQAASKQECASSSTSRAPLPKCLSFHHSMSLSHPVTSLAWHPGDGDRYGPKRSSATLACGGDTGEVTVATFSRPPSAP
eukprot:gene15206-21281_t